MTKTIIQHKCIILSIAISSATTVMHSFAGAPGPPFSESATLANIQKLKESKDEVMQGDRIPRRERLAHALYSLANFYNNSKSYDKSDQYYAEVFALFAEDKTESGLSSYRYYADLAAKDYMARNDLEKAKNYVDIAIKICREQPKDKEVLPWVLTTQARLQIQNKQFNDAESTLLEAIGIMGEYGFGQRRELACVYLESGQLVKADKIISEMEKSSYSDSSCMFLRAKWLRATGKVSEADQLDKQAQAKKLVELEQQRNSQ
jgi:tetratricopeptide (TPR) repeat protein